jgi:hypothetical protein
MTARTSTVLKNNWDERNPKDQHDDLVDTLHNPQSAVTFAGAISLGTTLAVTGASTFTGAVTLNGATTAAGTFTASEPIVLNQGLDHSNFFQIWDDFIQQTLTEADGPWIENSGASGTAADPAISAQANGVVRLTTGDDDGTTAQDGSQLVGHIPVQASSGALFFETRLHINTAIANARVNAGFTDATGLEEPYTCTGTAYAANANDAVVFLYDEAATASGSWHAVAVDSTVEDTTNDPVASGPTADTYQVLRLEVSVGGGTCTFWIDDTLVATRTGGGVTPNVNLYPTVIACGDGTASKTVDIDYITFGHTRA